MAIYKPSNCTPFLTAKDLTKGFDISCELNTSNEIVTGYKIRILDSKNNLVYEGDEYSEINFGKYKNKGLNGSMLILPLVVNSESKPAVADMRKNVIYHYVDGTTDKFAYLGKKNGANAVVDINAENSYLFTNQSANQPFKWEITLAQGQATAGGKLSQTPSDKYYDMTVSTGKILGSCGERIQSYLSEYIYKDYYLQLYSDENAETQLGQRVRISSYDHSYGYIYPQEGTLDDGTVQNAKSFQVFKDTNDPQYVSATRKVDYISYSNPLLTSMVDQSTVVTLDTNNNALTLIYKGKHAEYGSLSTYVEGVSTTEKLTSNTTILFVNCEGVLADITSKKGIVDELNYSSSKYNGVWQFVSCTVDNAKNKTTVNWQRPSAFSNYAAYIGRAINVANGTYGARNYSCDAQPDIGGKINETALTFYDEMPVGLYPAYNEKKEVVSELINGEFHIDEGQTAYFKVIKTPSGYLVNNVVSAKFTNLGPEEKAQIIATPAGGNHIKIFCSGLTSGDYKYTITYNYLTSIAPVLKTGYIGEGNDKKYVVYLNPSINVENDMKLFSGNNLLNNYTISDFDNEPNLGNKFSPTYSAVLTANDGVKTYPKLNDDYEIRSFFKVSDENPFYAYDTPTITIDVKPKKDDSGVNFVATNRYIDVSATYIQNQNKSWKSFYWTLEDGNGYVKTTDKTYVGEIKTKFLGLESGKSYDLTLYLEDEMGNFYTITKTVYCGANVDTETHVDFNGTLSCNNYAVDIHVGANGLIDKPTVQKSVELGYNDAMQIKLKDKAPIPAKDKPLVSYEYIKLGPSQSPIPNIFTADKPVKLVSEHTGLASDFKGGIIEYQIDNETVGAYLESLVVDSGVEINGKKLTKVNPNRNNIYFKNNVTPNNVSWQTDADGSVLSTWIPENSTQDNKKEYIDSDISPRNEKWVNIKDELNNQNSSSAIIMPFNATSNTSAGNNISVWSDRKIEYDSVGSINVFVLNKNGNNYEYNTNTWSDENHYWQDAPVNSGEIKEYKNGSAQTNLRNQTFKFEFNKAVGGNYKVTVTQTDKTKTTEVEING